ncbi:MAG: hypothetical protein ABJA16_01545 [Nakamurella sp.]
MRLPGPADLFRITEQGYAAVERAIGLVPQLVDIIGQVEALMRRVGAVVTAIEDTQRQAAAAIARVERMSDRVGGVLDTAGGLMERAEDVVGRSSHLVRRVEPLLDSYEPLLSRLEPLLTRLADTTSVAEITAVVRLINALPAIVDKVDADILPVLDTLGTVAPDLRDLLDMSKELNELIGSVPGLGRVKRKLEEQQDESRAAAGYTADETPSAAPERRDGVAG